MYEKNFDEWNEVKCCLDLKNNFLQINEREIWWCSIRLNLGDEVNGKNENFERPVLIVKKFNNRVAFILPLTSNGKNNKFYYKIKFHDKESFLLLSQLRLISVKRLQRFIVKINYRKFLKIKNSLLKLFC